MAVALYLPNKARCCLSFVNGLRAICSLADYISVLHRIDNIVNQRGHLSIGVLSGDGRHEQLGLVCQVMDGADVRIGLHNSS